MSPRQYPLNTFRNLPLPTQLILIASLRTNPLYADDPDYIEELKRIHGECIAKASNVEKKAYDRAIASWVSP